MKHVLMNSVQADLPGGKKKKKIISEKGKWFTHSTFYQWPYLKGGLR